MLKNLKNILTKTHFYWDLCAFRLFMDGLKFIFMTCTTQKNWCRFAEMFHCFTLNKILFNIRTYRLGFLWVISEILWSKFKSTLLLQP